MHTNWLEVFKKAMVTLERTSEYATFCEKFYEEHPEDEQAEMTFDKAYEMEYNAFIHASNALSNLIGVDEGTARKMIKSNKDYINNLLSRVA